MASWLRHHPLRGRASSGQESRFLRRANRIVVATYQGLGHTAPYRLRRFRSFDVSWLDLVIVADAITATGKRASACLSHAIRARLVGFLVEGVKTSPLERNMLAALFGFHEISAPQHGQRERPVPIAAYPIEGGNLPSLGQRSPSRPSNMAASVGPK
jgi:hypothetical protein